MASINGNNVNNARYFNADMANLYKNAGFNPVTGEPTRQTTVPLKESIKTLLKINDEQVAINSVVWYNLPDDLDGELIERIIYYVGQGAFFYNKEVDKCYFLPFALGSKGIDVYGRFINISPLPFNGKTNAWLESQEYDVAHAFPFDFDYTKAIILTDRSKEIAQTITPRASLNEEIIDLESDLLPFARTNLLSGTGVTGMRVSSEDEVPNVNAAAEELKKAALLGKKYVGIFGSLDFQDLTNGSLANVDSYLMAMQSIDNFRLQTHGVDSGGIFQKQAHMLQSENAMNASLASLVMQDRIIKRQRFCDLVNSYFNLNIWCEVSESASLVDKDFDGELLSDEQQFAGAGGAENADVQEL